MQLAEFVGIDEIELRGFLKAIPNIWNNCKKFYETGIDFIISNFVDTENLLSSTHLYRASAEFIILFTEYLKDVGAATFKIHAYQLPYRIQRSNGFMEVRLRNIIMEYSDRDFSTFRELANLKIFVCPVCKAQYSFRVLKMRDDGLFQCQNCGKFVSVKETKPESETHFMLDDKDASERLV